MRLSLTYRTLQFMDIPVSPKILANPSGTVLNSGGVAYRSSQHVINLAGQRWKLTARQTGPSSINSVDNTCDGRPLVYHNDYTALSAEHARRALYLRQLVLVRFWYRFSQVVLEKKQLNRSLYLITDVKKIREKVLKRRQFFTNV